MKYFSSIGREHTGNRLIYTSVTALCLVNPESFNFLSSQYYKYNMSSDVLKNIMYIECEKRNIDIQPDLFPINIEMEWENIIECYKTALKLRDLTGGINSIVMKDRGFLINDQIMFCEPDMLKFYESSDEIIGERNELYNNTFKDMLGIINDYIKPDYTNLLRYFFDVFREKDIPMNYKNASEVKVDGLGIRADFLPMLYYNNMAYLIHDLINYRDAFRDYDLFFDLLVDNTMKLKIDFSTIDKDQVFFDIVSNYLGRETEIFYFLHNGNIVLRPELEGDVEMDIIDDFSIWLNSENVSVKIDFPMFKFLLERPCIQKIHFNK